jgi:hypothetical protein
MQRKYYIITVLLLFILASISCKKDEVTTILKNDCIMRSFGPNLVGLQLEFAYAMALPKAAGTIKSASVQATIAGAAGTYMENRSFFTNSSGVDVPDTVGSPSVTTDTRSDVTFTVDTCAATLRYYYVIPEAARGQSVSFTFSAKASNGESVSYFMGPYKISSMDMKLDIILSDNNLMYLSVADMTAYNAATAASDPGKIDLVYLYRVITGITFSHALSSPAASADYLPGVTLPSGVINDTKLVKTFGLRDQQLARLQYGIFIDDLDFQKLDFSDASDYNINIKAEAGAWVETADGKYRAFIYVNAIDNTAKTMRISIKRFTMK